MARFLLRRFAQALIVVVCVSIIAFALVRLAPGNPARLLLPDGASDEQVAAMEAHLGLDKPYVTQYFIYISNVLKGDLGTSLTYKLNCGFLIGSRMGATIELTIAITIVGLLLSLPLGIVAGINQGSGIDLFAVLFALIGQSISVVWLAMELIMIFALKLNWLPALGYGEFRNIILPALCLGYPMAASITRMLRSGMIDVMKEDYITSIKAKGISNSVIYFKYALKNALIPVVILVGAMVGHYLGGALVAEQIFSWPGIGALTVKAISMRDYPLIQSILLCISTMFVGVNILVDIVNSLVDPRITLH